MRYLNFYGALQVVIALVACCFLASCNTAPSPPACTTWQIMQGQNPGNVADELEGVAALSSNNIWAVGDVADTSTSTEEQTLVEHWDGQNWRVVPSQNANTEGGFYPNYLKRITGSSATDLWAIGAASNDLLEHWNGQSWSVVDFLNSSRTFINSTLSGIVDLSPTDAWFVGSTDSGNPTRGLVALTGHWNGQTWSLVPNPDLHADLNGTELYDVAALAPDNVWAVGDTSSQKGQLALIEHWNGKSWTVMPSPQPQGIAVSASATLFSLSALSASDIWAAGFYESSGGIDHYLVEHWDGQSWNLVPIPTPLKFTPILYQIVASSDHNVWVLDDDGAMFHWNSRLWSPSALPGTSQQRYHVKAIAATPDGKLWLVGTTNDPTGPGPRTLIATSCP